MILKCRVLIPAAMIFMMLKAYPSGAEANQPSAAFEILSTQFFKNNCISSHGEKKQKDDVTLHDMKMGLNSAEAGQRWMSVLNKLENGEMPLEEKKQPTHAERARMIGEY
jgi:hypothetical protein